MHLTAFINRLAHGLRLFWMAAALKFSSDRKKSNAFLEKKIKDYNECILKQY